MTPTRASLPTLAVLTPVIAIAIAVNGAIAGALVACVGLICIACVTNEAGKREHIERRVREEHDNDRRRAQVRANEVASERGSNEQD